MWYLPLPKVFSICKGGITKKIPAECLNFFRVFCSWSVILVSWPKIEKEPKTLRSEHFEQVVVLRGEKKTSVTVGNFLIVAPTKKTFGSVF